MSQSGFRRFADKQEVPVSVILRARLASSSKQQQQAAAASSSSKQQRGISRHLIGCDTELPPKIHTKKKPIFPQKGRFCATRWVTQRQHCPCSHVALGRTLSHFFTRFGHPLVDSGHSHVSLLAMTCTIRQMGDGRHRHKHYTSEKWFK